MTTKPPNPITQPQADSLLALLAHSGVVPTSDWTTGYGQQSKRRAVPPGAARLTVSEARNRLRGEVRRAFDRLVATRPRVQEVVAVTDLRGARRALRLKADTRRSAAAPRYIVEPCDNLGSIEGLVRDRTWAVVEVTPVRRECIGDYETRAEAYAAKRELEVAS